MVIGHEAEEQVEEEAEQAPEHMEQEIQVDGQLSEPECYYFLDPIKVIPLCHIPPQRSLSAEQEMLSPQAPPPTWDSPPRPSPLKSKKNLLPYLEAADLETSSQAASYREEHLLATPEEDIDPKLMEFVKRSIP
ncbi:unnamed protein product [Microthlaspi erraticum]|uniref:Uncharacterized protein n=1 Tax=Microthlaspi erraticum TaxID=1685480 RepID=A0A6D2I0Y9_9BRAS|nr:unnamed protein product [Microthlaspi erraticum]